MTSLPTSYQRAFDNAVRVRPSREGKYRALTITIEARSQTHLDAIYMELSGHERILMVL